MTMKHPTQALVDIGLPLIQEGEYQSYDSGGVESAIGELLYSFVKVLRPERCLETGLYSGISCMYVALALQENNKGHIDTIEYEQEHIKRSKERIIKLGVQDRVTILQEDSRVFVPQGMYDLMFLDTELNLRFGELTRFYDHLSPGGYVFIHDMPRNLCQGNVNLDHPEIESWPVGRLPEEVKTLVAEKKLTPMYFTNPRGMIGFYKRHQEDYL